jgi:hypothetical protein
MFTRAHYYAQRLGGRWRTARVEHRCDWRRGGFRCRHMIAPNALYFDTKLKNPYSSNEHATYRICDECANEEIDLYGRVA